MAKVKVSGVRELCLGVAMAGLVAGAGSGLACAVASAEPSETTATSDSAGPQTGPRAARGPARTESGSADRDSKRGGPVGPSAGASAPTRSVARVAAGAQRDVAPEEIGSPADAQPLTAAAAAAPPAAAAAATPRPATWSPARLAYTAAALLVPAPSTPLSPGPLPAPGPAPVVPVAPASAVTVTASATTSRGRSASAVAAQIADPPPPTHVLLIGTDGTNLSKVLEYDYDDPASGFRTLMAEGVTGATSIVGHTTISGPSWSTILTGAWDNKTGVINNIFDPAPYNSWPTVFNLIEYHQPSVNTAIVANWRYMNDIAAAGGYPADVNDFIGFDTSWEDTDDLVAQRTIALINSTPASGSAFIFSYQVAVDEAGHAHGGDSPEYVAAVINTSQNIKAIMDAIDAWETANPGQQWTVITTTDHGHQPDLGFGHGFQTPAETSSFVIFDLEGDEANDGTQNLGYTNADITPTIVSLFGITQRSDFDGVPLQTRADGIVRPTDLKQSVSDAIGNFGYPDISTDISLSVRTVFASIPYFLDGFVTSITAQLQAVVDADIFLISALAAVAEFAVQIVGDGLVGVTQAVARLVATLTGSGVIPPSDDPLPPPTADALIPTAILA